MVGHYTVHTESSTQPDGSISIPDLITNSIANLYLQYTIRLNLEPAMSSNQPRSAVDVYLYTDEHVVIPRYSGGVYGSALKTIKIADNTSYFEKFYVLKNRDPIQ